MLSNEMRIRNWSAVVCSSDLRGPVAAPIRSSWRVPMSNAGGAGCGKKNGPNSVGPMSADGRLSLHVLERLQPCTPLPVEREDPLPGVHNGTHEIGSASVRGRVCQYG